MKIKAAASLFFLIWTGKFHLVNNDHLPSISEWKYQLVTYA